MGEFFILKNVLNMLTDSSLALTEQLSQLPLRKPQGFSFQHDVNPGSGDTLCPDSSSGIYSVSRSSIRYSGP